jgi:O-antigen ligase
MDAWVAFILLVSSAVVIARTNLCIRWCGIAVVALALPAVPLVQYFFGLIPLAGSAWTSSAYLLGFLLAIQTGRHWESGQPGQMGDFVFSAIGGAALISVGLQLQQWMALDLFGVWSLQVWGEVPFANFAQPNQLGTFLLWGLLAILWGVLRQRIGIWTALLMCGFLLFGLALTASRTAWIGVGILVAASWFWRALWPDRRLPWIVSALGLYFVVCVNTLVPLSQWLAVDLPPDVGTAIRMGGQIRLEVWAVFVDAILRQPLFGYGWNRGGLAFMTAMENHATFDLHFSTAHNLFLDLLAWCGIPIGLFLTVFLVRWVWIRVQSTRSPESAVLVLMLLAIGNHAMLENPLYHGYFLIPVGVVIGAVSVHTASQTIFKTGRWVIVVLWLVSAALLAVIVRDYTRVESSYLDLRFEEAQIKVSSTRRPPDVWLLNQWSEFIHFARVNPFTLKTQDELERMRKVASTFPSKGLYFNFALALAMNDQPAEAQMWLQRLCKNEPEFEWRGLRAYWGQQSQSNPEIAAVPWPQ